MKANEILKTMFTAAGVSLDDAKIKSILDNTSLASIDVDDAVSTKLTADRFTLDAAKNNPELHKHFKAVHLNGVDAEVNRLSDEYGLEDTDKTEIKSAENSYKRITTLANKIQKLVEKKSGATGKDKDTLTKEIEKLNSEIKTVRDGHASELAATKANFDNERLGWKLDSVYGQFVPQMDKKLSAKVNLITARTIASDAITKKGLKIVDKEGNLSLVTAEGTDYYENNAKVSVEDFVSKTLANERLLNATPPPPKQEQRQPSRENGHGIKADAYLVATESNI
jgi:hypothetical protein